MTKNGSCERCDGITKDGSRCKRFASCKVGCKKMCWQHAQKYIRRKGCPTEKNVRFASKNEERIFKLKSEEKKAKRQAIEALSDYNENEEDCIQFILGRLNVWDEDDLRKVRKKEEKKVAKTCLKILEGERPKRSELTLMNNYVISSLKALKAERKRALR